MILCHLLKLGDKELFLAYFLQYWQSGSTACCPGWGGPGKKPEGQTSADPLGIQGKESALLLELNLDHTKTMSGFYYTCTWVSGCFFVPVNIIKGKLGVRWFILFQTIAFTVLVSKIKLHSGNWKYFILYIYSASTVFLFCLITYQQDANVGKSLFMLYALKRSPRLTLFYLYVFDYSDTFLPFLHTCCPAVTHTRSSEEGRFLNSQVTL